MRTPPRKTRGRECIGIPDVARRLERDRHAAQAAEALVVARKDALRLIPWTPPFSKKEFREVSAILSAIPMINAFRIVAGSSRWFKVTDSSRHPSDTAMKISPVRDRNLVSETACFENRPLLRNAFRTAPLCEHY